MHTILIELWPLFSLVVHCSSLVEVGDSSFVSGLIFCFAVESICREKSQIPILFLGGSTKSRRSILTLIA